MNNTKTSGFKTKNIKDGDFIEIDGRNIQFNRVNSIYTRNVILADNTTVDATERVIGEGVPIAGNELTKPASARILSIASTSANDTAAGTGMRSVLIVGLDEDFNSQNEIITMNGQTEVDTVNQYLRVNEIIIRDVGSTNINEGIIYVSDDTDTFVAGVPQNRVYDIMGAGEGLSKTGLYTVPGNQKVIMQRIIINTDADTNKPGIIKLYRTTKTSGFSSEIVSETFYLSGAQQADVDTVRIFAPKEEVRITAQKSGATDIAVAVKIHTILERI